MLTGESMPVEKRPADDDKEAAGKVYGGTINAGPGVLFARVTAVGTESLLASIVKLVEQAQGSKTQIEALADYVARNFVAGVVAVAVAAFALWFSLAATEAVPGTAALRRADDAAAPELVLHVGTRDLVAAAGGGRGALGPSATRAKALEADGATVVFVHAAVGGRRLVADDFRATAKKPPPAGSGDVVGMIGVADIIRDEAARVVSHLQSNLGIEVWMLTGDNERTAQAIARQCGISRVLAKVRPDDKARNVASLMDQGVVAMVGDGVNDSPALAAADLGVAIGAGAQIAVETADVVLIRSVLGDVATAIEVAAPPWCSSVSVVASSLSLRSYKPPSASPRAGDGDPTLRSCAVRCCSVRFHCGADRATRSSGPARTGS
ncbi:cation-transporting ATPase [Aureococcus anophagefferens]|nr:cation-transporting ATPase [Aureococcus anophagefferens]